MKPKKTIAVDFDGVIHRYKEGWLDGEIYDIPIKGRKWQLAELASLYNVVIFTTRLSWLANGWRIILQWFKMWRWLNKYGFIKGIHYHKLTGWKPQAIKYLDDRGVKVKPAEDITKLV